MYSDQVLDHFHHPRHVGEIAAPSAVVEVHNPVCGDVLKLWVKVAEGRITEAKFKTAGCVPAVACGSWLTEQIENRSLSDLRSVPPEQIETALGGLPPASRHASVLASSALERLIDLLRG